MDVDADSNGDGDGDGEDAVYDDAMLTSAPLTSNTGVFVEDGAERR